MRLDTLKDRIEAYYLDNAILEAKDLEICQRLELVFSLYCHHRSKKETITKFLKLLEEKGKPISEVQAYRDLRTAEEIFTPLNKYQKEFLRLTIIQSALADIKRIEARMRSAKSNSEFVALLQTKDKREQRIVEASGLAIDDPNLPDFSKLIPHVFKIELPPQTIRVIKSISQSGVVDLTQIDFTDADIIEE